MISSNHASVGTLQNAQGICPFMFHCYIKNRMKITLPSMTKLHKSDLMHLNTTFVLF
jgi:hypothetical protein